MVIIDRRHKQGNYRAALITSSLITHLITRLYWSLYSKLCDHIIDTYQCTFSSYALLVKSHKPPKKKSEYLPHMQIYLQILSTICYPVSRDQFVDLCPALSKFAHGLDFLKGKFILSGLCAVRVGRGVNPEGICLTIVKPTRVDHWPQTGVSLSLEAPFSLTSWQKKCMNLNLKWSALLYCPVADIVDNN